MGGREGEVVLRRICGRVARGWGQGGGMGSGEEEGVHGCEIVGRNDEGLGRYEF